MNDRQLQTVERVREFLEGSEVVEFRGLTAQEKYCWIEEVLIRFRYHRLKRAERLVDWEKARLNELFYRYPDLGRAWVLKESFRDW